MHKLSITLRITVLLAALSLQACGSSPDDNPAAANDAYARKAPARDGIGKIYLGREISQVMGHLGASWLERDGRVQEERTDLLIQNLPIEPNHVIADIGAGTGYFSFPMAKRVPQGRVLAVDIQREMLDIVEARAAALGVTNVQTVRGTERDPGLAPDSVDLILIVDAYHEFSYPLEMGQGMARALKPGGRLVLIEYRGEDRDLMIKPLHKMTEAQAQREMQALGLTHERTEGFLPTQHFMVFIKAP